MMSASERPRSRRGCRSASSIERVVDDALREIHDRDVGLVQSGGAVVERDLAHRLAEALQQHFAVCEAAVARAQPPCRRSVASSYRRRSILL